ncbi:MAG: hypothetical protein ACREDS_07650, partial [Limisphaerales bacterium]
MKANTKPLAREEWNFSGLDDEQEAQLAFYYEYGRSSDAVKKEVEKMRAARPHPRTWSYYPHEHHLRGEVLHWLAEQEPHFPETSWLTLKDNTIAEIKNHRAKIWEERVVNVQLPHGQILPYESPDKQLETIEWICKAIQGSNVILRISGAGFSHVWMGSEQEMRAWQKQRPFQVPVFPPEVTIQLKPEGGIISGGIDWRATDEEILKRFAWFLERERPAQFKANATTRRGQRGYDISFPFRPSSALNWLG